MLINADLSTDAAPANLQRQRAEAGAVAPQSSTTVSAPSASHMDPSLQRLTEAPSSLLDGDSGIHDESQASQITDSLLQTMRGQPATAMGAQANQLSENVLSLLQSTA